MKLKIYADVKEFYRDTYGILTRHEAQNLIPLGNIIIGNAGEDKTGWRDPAKWFMAAVSDGSGIRLTAIMTPPYNLTLYETGNMPADGALSCLIEGILGSEIEIPGVMTESGLAHRFADAYAAASNVEQTVRQNMRIHELETVNITDPPIGYIRQACESDLAFLPYWIEGFHSDCFHGPFQVGSDLERYRYEVSTRRLYILEEAGTPVSMAQITREMQTVCGVGYVYTPPFFRNRGYATACVEAVSRLILEHGYKKCVLYTDLANPTSNSIYRKIGYIPICDALDIGFSRRSQTQEGTEEC